MTPLLRRVRALLPPEIAGLIIAIIGLSIAVLGVRYSLGITASGRVNPTYLAIAAVSLTTMVILNVWTKGYARMFCVLFGIVAGYGASAALGILDLSAAVPSEGLHLLRLPGLHILEWRFDATLLAPSAIVALAGTLHLIGNISTAQRINDKDWVRPNFGSLTRAYAGNGLASVICGLIGSLEVNSNSSSIGLSTATGVTSRSVAYVISIVFALLALMSPAAAVFATMPAPVIGAALFFTAAFVFTSGLQMITARLLDSRKVIVIGFSFAMAMIADIYHDVLAHAPVVFEPILDNALVLGTVSAVLLNLIMRIGVRKRVSIRFRPGGIEPGSGRAGSFPSRARTGRRGRDIMQRAMFGVMQSLDVLGQTQGDTEIEAAAARAVAPRRRGRAHDPGGGRDRRRRDGARRRLRRAPRRHGDERAGDGPEGGDDRARGDAGAAARRDRRAARRPLDRHADEDRAVGPAAGAARPPRRVAAAGARRRDAGRLLRDRVRGGAPGGRVPHARDPA